jgi:hypothetical protein
LCLERCRVGQPWATEDVLKHATEVLIWVTLEFVHGANLDLDLRPLTALESKVGSMTYVPNELLGRLVGRELESVCFYANHAEFIFEGDPNATGYVRLNCDVWPVVEVDGTVHHESDVGYADALRHLIPQEVTATTEAGGSGLCVHFASGRILINPTTEDLVGPEIAMLSGFEDNGWMVWRPGEDSFENLR